MFQLSTPLAEEGLGPCTGLVLFKTDKQSAWDLNPEPCSRLPRVLSRFRGHYFTQPLLSMALAPPHTSSFTQGPGTALGWAFVVTLRKRPVSGDQTVTVPTQGASGTGAQRPGEGSRSDWELTCRWEEVSQQETGEQVQTQARRFQTRTPLLCLLIYKVGIRRMEQAGWGENRMGTSADRGAPGWHTVGLTLGQLLLTPGNWLLHKEVL